MENNGFRIVSMSASILAVVIAIASVAFSYGMLTARINLLQDQVQDLKGVLKSLPTIEKDVATITAIMQVRETRLSRIETDIDTLEKNIVRRAIDAK
jgi:septal ring factor EnvC (AmiA/AmiB activator)